MYGVRRFILTCLNLITLLTVALSEVQQQQEQQQQQQQQTQHAEQRLLSSANAAVKHTPQLVRVNLSRTPYEQQQHLLLAQQQQQENESADAYAAQKRVRRAEFTQSSESNEVTSNENESSFQKDEIGWSMINEEVDTVIPMVLQHLQKLEIEHLQLPDIKESISVSPLFITYEAGIFLTNGIAYNIEGIKRYGDAYMTYEDKSFLCRFNLLIKNLQFEYDFMLKLMAIEGYGRVIGSLENTVIYSELAINAVNLTFNLNDFRIMSFSHVNVQLDQTRIIRQLTGAILTPITNLFRDRITTSISDGLKDQMQMVMTDFNGNDPLELRPFAKRLLAGLTGDKSDTSKE